VECFDEWYEVGALNADQRIFIIDWIMSRAEDPYQGVQRERGFENLWWGVIPNTDDDAGKVVVCTYWVNESSRTVRCDMLALLNRPV
jgi:hypothetical protein